MRQLVTPVGYGQTTSIELDNFARIRMGHFRDTEEVRYDRPTAFAGMVFEYIGVSESQSPIEDPSWVIIRCTWINGHKVREQIKSKVAWADRALVWED
jgi:hypothetical protein